jgi:hypothetical protein
MLVGVADREQIDRTHKTEGKAKEIMRNVNCGISTREKSATNINLGICLASNNHISFFVSQDEDRN